MKKCNVYFDGSNFYAVPIESRKGAERAKPVRDTNFEKAFNEIYEDHVSREFKNNSRGRNDLYKKICFDMKKNYGGEESILKDKIKVALINKFKAEQRRKERFSRKGMLHLEFWTHFITCTYNSAMMTEEEFEKRLRKFFSNCSERQGWVIQGRFERAPETGRLHFHGMARIPFGSSFSEIVYHREYNPLTHKLEDRYENVYVDTMIGRSDFEPVDSFDHKDVNVMAKVMDYIIKYSDKTGGKIYYSRGIPTGLEMEITEMMDVSSEVVKRVKMPDGLVFEFVTKKVLFKDKIMEKGEKYFDPKYFAARRSFTALSFT